MRHLLQPGPVSDQRIESFDARGQRIDFGLEAGLTLNEALTRPLLAAGLACATLRFAGVRLDPFAYVTPHPSPDAAHVAYFSPTRRPAGGAVVEVANATFGWRDGAPFVHCHGAWTQADGVRKGGHMLPLETIVAQGGAVNAWGTADVTIAAEPDAETNFPLFRPLRRGGVAAGRGMVVARVRPNQDIMVALEDVCRRHGLSRATVRGSLGSLIGARFTDGRQVDDIATEVMVLQGDVAPDGARLEMLVVDMLGEVHRGWLTRGENPVCITFELMLEAG
jgi:predicted DNA-binding protein with PD1-like motif